MITGSDDDSDVVVLDEAPAHMPRRSNAQRPIPVDSDSDEDEDDYHAEHFEMYTQEEKEMRQRLLLDPATANGSKRARSISSTLSERIQLDVTKKRSLEEAVQRHQKHKKRVRIALVDEADKLVGSSEKQEWDDIVRPALSLGDQ